MSSWNPNAARWDIPESNYNVVLGCPKGKIPLELQHGVNIIFENKPEIINWAAFFRSYLGRGLVCFRYTEGQYSFPAEYLQGQQISWLPNELLEVLDNMDLKAFYVFVLIDEDQNLFHALKWNYPDKIDPVFYDGDLVFEGSYTKEEDDSEILESTDPVFIASNTAFLENDYRKSFVLVNQVIDNNPSYSRAYSARGSLYEAFQDYRYALASYFDAMEVNPDNWRAYHNAGHLFYKVGERPLGMDYMAHAVDINPQFVEGIRSLAHMLHYNGDKETAVDVLNMGLKDNPDQICLQQSVDELHQLNKTERMTNHESNNREAEKAD